MAELLSWPEASAYFITGGGSGLLTFARSVNATLQQQRYSYYPPYATQPTFITLRGPATLAVGQAYNSNMLLKMAGLSGGSLNVHLKTLTPEVNASGGVWLYTGSIDSIGPAGTDGQTEQTLTVQATFASWSAY